MKVLLGLAKKSGLLVGLFIVLAFFITPSVSAAGTSINLTTSPVSEVLKSKPGSQISTTLHIENNNPEPVPIKIKLLTFGAAGTSGKPALRLATSSDTFLNWATFTPSAFVAQPKVVTAVRMTINIPKTASLGFNYGVAFEPITAASISGTGATISGSNVILILLNTSSSNEVHSIRIASFATTKKLYQYLPVTFLVNIHNKGNIFLAPGGDIFISKNSSFTPKSIIDVLAVNSGQGNVLPDTNRVFPAEWSDGFPVYVPEQTGGHQVVKDNHLVYKLNWNFSKINRFRFGEYYAKVIMVYNNGQKQLPVISTLSFWVIPWTLLLIILAVILIFVGLIVGFVYLIYRLRKLKKLQPSKKTTKEEIDNRR